MELPPANGVKNDQAALTELLTVTKNNVNYAFHGNE